MKGIESKSLPRGAVKVEQAAPGSREMGGRCARSVLNLLELLPWMRDVHPWPCMVYENVIWWCVGYSVVGLV
jgi:hypothetical protein